MLNKKFIVKIGLVLIFLLIGFSGQAQTESLARKLKGKILLQVEQNGEAWYINPANEKKYYMGRPEDAFNLMRELGVGISNDDLKKIAIAHENLEGEDSDGDGLSDSFEDAIGSDKNKKDTDSDGYEDKTEFLGAYNLNGSGKNNIDENFAVKQVGKILLQVEGRGEAWYVNPDNHNRYYLGRPVDALNVMKKVGLGVKNEDLNSIELDSGNTDLVAIESKENNDDKAAAEVFDISSCTGLSSEYSFSVSDQSIGSVKEQDLCINDLAVENDNFYLCDRISYDSGIRWACYTHFAQERQDVAICDAIDNTSYHKVMCYHSLAKKKRDLSLCDKERTVEAERDGYDVDLCYIDLAVIKKDYSICEKIDGKNQIIDCYSYFGYSSDDITFCDKMKELDKDDGYRNSDYCYIQHAIKKRDRSICEKVGKGEQGDPEAFNTKSCYEKVDGVIDGTINCTIRATSPFVALDKPYTCE